MDALVIKSLSASYEGRAAIEDVSLTVRAGEFCCLVGGNGSGKSTLLKCVMGLIPHDNGSVLLNMPKEEVAYVAQINLAERNFPATVKEIVMTGTQRKRAALPFYTGEDASAASEAISRMSIEPIVGRRIGELSGGQQQRVMLARALARRPKMLVLDEPCAGLDRQIMEEFYELIWSLHIERGMTVLMASHDYEQVERYADHIVEMDRTIAYDGGVSGWMDKVGT